MKHVEYDTVIVGASFAGLAVASRLRGRVLLIDRKGIGEGQSSACLTPLSLALRVAGHESLLQVHEEDSYLHVSSARISYPLPVPLCTFDYGTFCQAVFRRTGADFVQAAALGVEDGAVITDRGTFRGRVLVDASGWHGALANSLSPSFRGQQHLAFAMETEVEQAGETLRFWFDNVTKMGYQWVFPCGRFSRVGLGTYAETRGLKQRLAELSRASGTEVGSVHGGFLSCGLEDPIAGDVFLVGDAAGQCLPFTGEGIRPAVYFGQRCGDLLQQVLDREIDLPGAIREYRRLVAAYRSRYAFLERVQGRMKSVPLFGLTLIARTLSFTPLARHILSHYFRMFHILPPLSRMHGMFEVGSEVGDADDIQVAT